MNLHRIIKLKNTNRISNVKTTKFGMTQIAKVEFVYSWLQFDTKVNEISYKITNIGETFLAQFSRNSTVPTLSYNTSRAFQIVNKFVLKKSWYEIDWKWQVANTDFFTLTNNHSPLLGLWSFLFNQSLCVCE